MARGSRPLGEFIGARQQRGVAAIFAAVSLVTLLAALALGIDVGRLYYSNRDLQRQADLAAIDGARVRSRCLGEASLAEVNNEVAASLKRNRLPAGVTVVTRLGRRQSGEDGLQFFEPSNGSQPADSVQVTLSRRHPARILPLFTSGDDGTLSVRAAAKAQWVASARIGPPRGNSGNADASTPPFLDSVFGGSSGVGGGGSISGGSASATLSLADLFSASGEVTTDLPDIDTPMPVQGLLSQIAALLDRTGDGAAATAVSAYAAAVAAARPGGTVVPADVLGIPLEGSFDGATTTVGDALNAIAGAVSEGDPIALGNICRLIDLDELPTAQLLPAFCDSSVTLRVPQPSRTAVFNSSGGSSTDTTTESSDDAASSAGGSAAVQVGVVSPIDGQTLSLPLLAVAEPATATVTALSCARLGQENNVANVRASSARVTFAIGDSAGLNSAGASGAPAPENVLDDIAPTPLITATVQQLLATAGLGGLLISNPLNAPFLDQPVTLSVRAGPVVIDAGREQDLCLQGPPFGVAEQCNGAPATVGGTSVRDATQRVADALAAVDITVDGPSGLPLALDAALATATAALRQSLSEQLAPAIRTAATQLVPILESANLVVGESFVYLDAAVANQPVIYAQ